MVNNVQEEFVLPGGRGSTPDDVDKICQNNVTEFGKWIDTYSGKDKFTTDLKQGEEGTPLTEWVDALVTSHSREDMNLQWGDIDADPKDKIVKIFQANTEVWKWLCTNAKADD